MKDKKEKKPVSKAKKTVKGILIAVLVIILIPVLILGTSALTCTLMPGKEASAADITNPYISLDRTLVSAHRSGGGIAPENTMMAFENCINSEGFNVDIFEFDLHITKDGRLILLHDSTLDRTTNSVEAYGEEGVLPITKTYEELRELNFGENFQDENGNYPYRGLRGDDIPDNLRALLLEDVLDYLMKNGDFGYIIEIKDSGEDGFRAADELYRILKERQLFGNVIFGTFNGEVTDYVDEHCPEMMRSASIKETVIYYLACSFGINMGDDFYKFEALQIPANQYVVFRLGSQRVVNYAHRHNIAVQYWTINDPEDIEFLRELGADCIMSDVPDMAYDIINK